MSELLSTVRLLNGKWVGRCPECGRDDVPMKKWEHELRVHKTLSRGGDRCPGSGKIAVNVDEVSRQQFRGFMSGLFNQATAPGADEGPRSTPDLDWTEDGPGQYCAIWRGRRIYVVRDDDKWIVKRPGWPMWDIHVDGEQPLGLVQHAVADAFAK